VILDTNNKFFALCLKLMSVDKDLINNKRETGVLQTEKSE